MVLCKNCGREIVYANGELYHLISVNHRDIKYAKKDIHCLRGMNLESDLEIQMRRGKANILF